VSLPRLMEPEAPAFARLPKVPLKRRTLHGLQSLLWLSGLASLYVLARGIRGATILMYHSVAEGEAAAWVDPRDHLPPARFEAQMRFLARNRHVVNLTELVDALEAGRDLPARSVAITFDDGYLDNLTVAAPILERYGLPATLFLATGHLPRGESQWVDRLYGFFRARTADRLTLPGDGSRILELKDPRRERDAYDAACLRLLEAAPADRETWLRELEAQLKPGATPPRLNLTWDDVRELKRRHPRIELGGHTRGHTDLRSHGGETAAREIRGCADDLERETGARPRHFSYPYGRWTPEARTAVIESGYRSAVGEGSEFVIRAGADRFAMARIDPRLSMSRFRFATSGAYPGLSRALVGRA